MILEELATFIEAISGIGHVRAPTHPANLWLRHLPDRPDKAMVLLLAGGSEQDRVLATGAALDNWRVAIWFRDTTGNLAETTAWLVYRNLADIVNSTLSGTRWLRATPVQPPFLLERDKAERFVYALNVTVVREGQAA